MSIDQKIKSVINKRTSLYLAKIHLERLHDFLIDGYKEERRIKKIVEKEYKDVERLERQTIGRLFNNILGDLEEQLEIERQEYLQAVLAHKRLKESLKMMQYEKKILSEKVKTLPAVEAEYQELLAMKENKVVLRSGGVDKNLIANYNQQIYEAIELKRELYEAKIVATKIKLRLAKMINHLKEASLLDGWSSGSSISKKDAKIHVQKAHKVFYELKPLYFKLKTELDDVYERRKISVIDSKENLNELSSLYADNLISDWIVRKHIRNALTNVESLEDKIVRILKSLNHEENQANNTIEYIQKRKKALLLDGLK